MKYLLLSLLFTSCSYLNRYPQEVIDGMVVLQHLNKEHHEAMQKIIQMYEEHNKAVVSVYYEDMIPDHLKREEMKQKTFQAIEEKVAEMEKMAKFYYDMQEKLSQSIYRYMTK